MIADYTHFSTITIKLSRGRISIIDRKGVEEMLKFLVCFHYTCLLECHVMLLWRTQTIFATPKEPLTDMIKLTVTPNVTSHLTSRCIFCLNQFISKRMITIRLGVWQKESAPDLVIWIDTNIEVLVVSLTTCDAHHSPRVKPEGCDELPRSLMRQQRPKLRYQFLFYHDETKLMMKK